MMISVILKKIKAGKRALTFIELLLVIIIIGISIGISQPQFRKSFRSLQLNNFSRELQIFMDYLRQRSIVESKIIYLNIKDKEYSSQIQDASTPFKTYPIPKEIKIEVIKLEEKDNPQILFYPDGRIDKVTIKLTNPNNQEVNLTTEGMFGKVKIKTED